jgi:polyhydroxybutyrate depolymerase
MAVKDGEVFTFSLFFGERQRSYVVFRSSKSMPDRPCPLVIMLHGGGSSPALVLEKYDWTAKASAEGFILVLPEACVPNPAKPASFRHNPRAWNDGSGFGYAAENNIDDTGFIACMIEDMSQKLAVDQSRIFLAGFSNGASMALRAGLELGSRIAAVGAVSGHLWLESAAPYRPVPLVYIIGSRDPINPVAGGYSTLPWGRRIPKPPIKETIDRWMKVNGCEASPQLLQDQNGVKKVLFESEPGCKLLYYEVAGLGHVWPGGVEELPRNITGPRSDLLSATDAIWDFFKEHKLS